MTLLIDTSNFLFKIQKDAVESIAFGNTAPLTELQSHDTVLEQHRS